MNSKLNAASARSLAAASLSLCVGACGPAAEPGPDAPGAIPVSAAPPAAAPLLAPGSGLPDEASAWIGFGPGFPMDHQRYAKTEALVQCEYLRHGADQAGADRAAAAILARESIAPVQFEGARRGATFDDAKTNSFREMIASHLAQLCPDLAKDPTEIASRFLRDFAASRPETGVRSPAAPAAAPVADVASTEPEPTTPSAAAGTATSPAAGGSPP